MASLLTADEQPVLASDRDRTHGTLGEVVVNRQVPIFDVPVQRHPLVARIRCRLAEQALGLKRFLLQPLSEFFQQRCSMFPSFLQTSLALQPWVARSIS